MKTKNSRVQLIRVSTGRKSKPNWIWQKLIKRWMIKKSAKEMLEEVIRDGDAKQKKAAKKLLKSL